MARSYAALIGLLAAVWGASYLFIKVAVRDFAPAAMMELAAASMLGGAIVLLSLALFQIPEHAPSWKPVTSLVALTLLGTTVAQLILYRAIRLHGSARTTLVTFLMPPTALIYGALLLGEPITIASVGGLGLILFGIVLGSGAFRLNRAAPAPAP